MQFFRGVALVLCNINSVLFYYRLFLLSWFNKYFFRKNAITSQVLENLLITWFLLPSCLRRRQTKQQLQSMCGKNQKFDAQEV